MKKKLGIREQIEASYDEMSAGRHYKKSIKRELRMFFRKHRDAETWRMRRVMARTLEHGTATNLDEAYAIAKLVKGLRS